MERKFYMAIPHGQTTKKTEGDDTVQHLIRGSLGKGGPWDLAFANFHSVNTPTTAHYKLPTWHHWT